MTGELTHNCKACAGNEKCKVEWGCNKDAPVEVFTINCVRCYGSDKDCPVCKGKDREHFYRCPVKLLTKETLEFLKYYRFFKDGIMPVAGGVYEQSGTFIRAVEIVNKELQEAERKQKG